MISPRSDAFGAMLMAHLEKRTSAQILERDDGLITVMPSAEMYFSLPARWPEFERRILRAARGSVLDVGCGAGRHALELQRRGMEVLGVDESPLAIQVCRRRGVRRVRSLAIEGLQRLGMTRFDTVLLLGNNFGLLHSIRRGRAILRTLARITTSSGQLLVHSLDVYQTDDPRHLAYHRRNRVRGRAPGQIRFRVRFEDRATAWFDYLMVSQAEMRRMIAGTGWRIATIYPSGGPAYGARLVKNDSGRGRSKF